MAASKLVRKFPYNLDIGTDICHIARIRGILKSTRAHRFVHKILNTNERAHPKIQWLLESQSQSQVAPRPNHSPTVESGDSMTSNPRRARPGPGPRDIDIDVDIDVAATFMAGRFAAKEAVIKAHPHRLLTWHDITIQSRQAAAHGHPARGAPVAIVRGEHGGDEDREALVSISHDGEYATGMCLGAGREMMMHCCSKNV